MLQIDDKLAVIVGDEAAFAEVVGPLAFVVGGGLLEDLEVVGEGWCEAKAGFEEDWMAEVRDAIRR